MNYSRKNKLAALLLCFFLGTLGVHRMYIGRMMSGLIMLGLTILGAVLSLFGLGVIVNGAVALWAVIDFIRLCLGGLTDSDGKALKFGN